MPDFESGAFDHSATFPNFPAGGGQGRERPAFYPYSLGAGIANMTRLARHWPAIRLWALVLTGALGLAGCAPDPVPPPQDSGVLVVATRNSPTTYFLDTEEKPAGFEHDLVRAFAAEQGWRVEFVVADDLQEMFDWVDQGQVHLAAAGLTATEERRARRPFGPVYGQVKEWVVCKPGPNLPGIPADLVGRRLEVVAGSSHAERLGLLRKRLPGLAWVEMNRPGSEELLERVEMGLADCTVVDSDTLDVARNFHPGLRPAFLLGEPQPQAWALGPAMDTAIKRKLAAFFKTLAQSGELARLKERYFGHVTRLQEADVLDILGKRGDLLGGLRRFFHEAQVLTGLDWRLLAAIAYQESQWNAHAVSPTGVRGIMMLTEDTADHLGVKDRLDPRESILGGARYVALLRDGLPPEVAEPDRTWLALAAYNIGRGHLDDARRLARRLGKNPDDWRDMKQVLPLLSRAEHSRALQYGYARGGEARAFAENVRIYYDILLKYEKPYRGFD